MLARSLRQQRVCQSVRPSHAGIVSSRAKAGSWSGKVWVVEKFARGHPKGTCQMRVGRFFRRFSTNMSSYLENGAFYTQNYYGMVIGNHRQAIDRQASYTIQLTTPLLLHKPCKRFASVARVCQRQLAFLDNSCPYRAARLHAKVRIVNTAVCIRLAIPNKIRKGPIIMRSNFEQ